MKTTRLIFVLFILSLSWPALGGGTEIVYVNKKFFEEKPKVQFGFDPFFRRPGAFQEVVENPELKLEAIVYNEQHPTAVVNGQVVATGQILGDDLEVVEIGPNFVLIKDHDKLRELRILRKVEEKKE